MLTSTSKVCTLGTKANMCVMINSVHESMSYDEIFKTKPEFLYEIYGILSTCDLWGND